MPIAFSCGSCGKSFRVSDEYAGRIAKCKQCGNSCWVPSAAQAIETCLNSTRESEAPGFPGLAQRLAEAEQPKTRIDTGAAIENASRWFAHRFGIRPVWPVTIATLGVIVGWLASQNRNLPEVQAIARHAFGADVSLDEKAVMTVSAAERAIDNLDTLAEIKAAMLTEAAIPIIGTWQRLSGETDFYESSSGVAAIFLELDGKQQMTISIPADGAIHPEAGKLLVLCCALGGDVSKATENAKRLTEWRNSDGDILHLHGATVSTEDSLFSSCFFRIIETPR